MGKGSHSLQLVGGRQVGGEGDTCEKLTTTREHYNHLLVT